MIQVQYKGEQKHFAPEEISSMVLVEDEGDGGERTWGKPSRTQW